MSAARSIDRTDKNILCRSSLDRRVRAANTALIADGVLPAGIDQSRIVVEPPRDAAHGDMATNAAMVLAKDAGKKPRELAEAIAAKLRADPLIAKVEVAGPGFINLTLKPTAWTDELRAILAAGADYGRSEIGQAGRSTSNMSPPIRPGRCMSAIAAARCSAMRSPTCWRSPASRSRANTTSTTPARRSTCSRARRSCATARRSARTSARSRRGSIPATISSRSARRWPPSTGTTC